MLENELQPECFDKGIKKNNRARKPLYYFLEKYSIINLMIVSSRKLAVSLLTLGFFTFVILSIFGLGHMSNMETTKDGAMEGCVFTEKTMLCKMGIVEHISLWQGMFTAMPQESLMFIALLILLMAVIFVTKNILAPPRLSRSEALTKRLYLRKNPDLLLFDFLKEAFSRGILNPKIYNPAHI